MRLSTSYLLIAAFVGVYTSFVSWPCSSAVEYNCEGSALRLAAGVMEIVADWGDGALCVWGSQDDNRLSMSVSSRVCVVADKALMHECPASSRQGLF